MRKRGFSERDICTKFITPAINRIDLVRVEMDNDGKVIYLFLCQL